MRLIINGKIYRLRENIIIRMQGTILLFMTFVCHYAGIDGVALFVGLCGVALTFGKINKE